MPGALAAHMQLPQQIANTMAKTRYMFKIAWSLELRSLTDEAAGLYNQISNLLRSAYPLGITEFEKARWTLPSNVKKKTNLNPNISKFELERMIVSA